MSTWTVARLKEELRELPDELEVFTTGCDCIGEVDKLLRVAPGSQNRGYTTKDHVLIGNQALLLQHE